MSRHVSSEVLYGRDIRIGDSVYPCTGVVWTDYGWMRVERIRDESESMPRPPGRLMFFSNQTVASWDGTFQAIRLRDDQAYGVRRTLKTKACRAQ